jgi:CRP/FNR family transcriptional regulator, cyclic AMP receptor protein
MPSIMDRFDEKGVLIALRRQRLIAGDEALAGQFANAGTLQHFPAGRTLIEQGGWDDDLHFILAGSFEIIVNGQQKAIRNANEHVGELAGLNGARPRTATVRAATEAVVLSIPSSDVMSIAGSDPDFWRNTADVVAERLEQRNKEVGVANEQPRVFVISSSEGKPAAAEVRRHLDQDDGIRVYLWDKGTFAISDYPVSSLEDAIEAADFTIAIARSDDAVVKRGEAGNIPRDNVTFEYGMSVGRLGRERSILLVDSATELKLPSDLAGLTTLRFNGSDRDKMERSVAKACDEARRHIEYLGVRRDRRAC